MFRKSGGGGNCTRSPFSVSVCLKCGYELLSDGWPEKGRGEEAPREVVASWHLLTPTVREKIIELVRGG